MTINTDINSLQERLRARQKARQATPAPTTPPRRKHAGGRPLKHQESMVRVAYRLPGSLVARLKSLATANGTTQTEILIRAIAELDRSTRQT